MKRIFLLTATTALFALFLAGCNGGMGNSSMTASPGNATLNTGDNVNDQIIKFELTINSVMLTGSGGTSNTGNLLNQPVEVEFVHEAGTFEPLAVINIPAGTYSGATLNVSNPEVVVVNNRAPAKVPATLTSSTVTVNFSPAITITNSNSMVINFDLDLASSVTLNGNPVTSATVSPVFNVTTKTVENEDNQGDDDGDIEDVHGKVSNIMAPDFTIQNDERTITFVTNSNTQFRDGLTSLSSLMVGDIVEVDGVTQSDGSKLATKVSLEEPENNEADELEGIITAVTGSPATQVTIAEQVDADDPANPALTINIAINSNTQFVVRPNKIEMGSTPAFDAGHIAIGQRIEVDTSNNTTTPIVADKIKLREQVLVGTVAASPAPTQSAFTLNLDPASAFAGLTGQTSIAVMVLGETDEQMTPMAGATIRVRGLIFFNAGTYTMIAVRTDNHDD